MQGQTSFLSSYALYDFLTGPALWFTFIVFFAGLVARVTGLLVLAKQKDPVVFNHLDAGWSLKSIFMWLVPLGSRSSREQPVFWLVVFVFHLCLLGVPLFLDAHNMMWREYFGWSFATIPDGLADWGTILVMAGGAFLFIRRLAKPEVRIITGGWDYLLLILTVAPFVTGFLAYNQIGEYRMMLNLHILSALVIMLILPFSKLAHMVLFFFTRAHIGSEFGNRRGTPTW